MLHQIKANDYTVEPIKRKKAYASFRT